jgi:hypothetical protein
VHAVLVLADSRSSARPTAFHLFSPLAVAVDSVPPMHAEHTSHISESN